VIDVIEKAVSNIQIPRFDRENAYIMLIFADQFKVSFPTIEVINRTTADLRFSYIASFQALFGSHGVLRFPAR
jgi:hypothetical protein